jgi:hypothetical protein
MHSISSSAGKAVPGRGPEISNNSSRYHRMAAGTSIAKLRPVNDDCRRRAAEANAGRSSGMALGALLYLWALVQPS